MTEAQQNTVQFKGLTEEVYSVADGQVIALEQVKDPVFAQKMMGDGFAVEPAMVTLYLQLLVLYQVSSQQNTLLVLSLTQVLKCLFILVWIQ